MGKYGWLVFLVIVIWQVIAQAAQAGAKNKERERLREAAEARKRTSPASSGPPPAPGPQPSRVRGPAATAQMTTGPASPGGGGRSRAEELAARRKAQLEELRRRRQAGASTQAKVGTPPAPPSPSPRIAPAPLRPPRAAAPSRQSKKIKTVDADYRSLRAAEDTEKRQRQLDRQRDLAAEDVQTRRGHSEERQRRASRETAREKARTAPGTVDEYALGRRGRTGRSKRIAELLGRRTTLRDVFLLKELLDAPLALRPERG